MYSDKKPCLSQLVDDFGSSIELVDLHDSQGVEAHFDDQLAHLVIGY